MHSNKVPSVLSGLWATRTATTQSRQIIAYRQWWFSCFICYSFLGRLISDRSSRFGIFWGGKETDGWPFDISITITSCKWDLSHTESENLTPVLIIRFNFIIHCWI